MADTSPALSLPYLAPAQAQKHVTHNEALTRLDILVQLTVTAFAATQPPGVPEEGAVYALGTGAQDAFAGQDGQLAAYLDGAWLFVTPKPGWIATEADTGLLRVYRDGDWQEVAPDFDDLDGVGVGTAADATNRLAVRGPASLFTGDGGGHRIKVNKDAAADTASLLFQSGYSGRAEIGLAGSEALSLKVSDDGSTWTEALHVRGDNGNIGLGTTDPKYPLHIHRPNGLGASILLSNGNSGSGATDGFWFGYSNAAYFWNYEATATNFATANTTRMTITAAGRVGIGTTAPSCALDVSGPVRPGSYASASRPDAAAQGAGAMIYDTGLAQPLWSDGTIWRDATGTAI
ncbi:DUF2793 domain-containing protein [Thalassococcus sp. BH17M4-6]|uniref:DUF2793 domain-containing protein n=1 Tax=Thalassococcus sp. BH17M4-6 TaxID=3413148 RepID=UPI003BBD1702